jgi:hypothetical protein
MLGGVQGPVYLLRILLSGDVRYVDVVGDFRGRYILLLTISNKGLSYYHRSCSLDLNIKLIIESTLSFKTWA